jgi:RND superfamily putative drug exporter
MPSSPQYSNLAGRMGRWSASHRKAAILGWFGFVFLAIVAGMTISQNKISPVDNFSGESHRAEQALDRAGLRPTSEVVFVQSRTFTIDDPEFRAAVQDAARSIGEVRYVTKVQSPLGGGEGSIATDRHAALVKFEIEGSSDETADRVDPVLAAVAPRTIAISTSISTPAATSASWTSPAPISSPGCAFSARC